MQPLNDDVHGVSTAIEEFLILEQALTRLAQAEPQLAQIVELHYFGGLTGPEISELLDVPVWTVTRDHRLAEAWLRRALSDFRATPFFSPPVSVCGVEENRARVFVGLVAAVWTVRRPLSSGEPSGAYGAPAGYPGARRAKN